MRHPILKKLFISFSLIGVISQTAFASFNDVNKTDDFYTSITFLEENNIINGYEDSTFKPNNTINRAEFLKIIIEGSNIYKNYQTTLPFNDTQQEQWFTKYIRQAYAEKWIQGYQDGNFRPEQTITKAEALKITAEVQNWQITHNIDEKPFLDTPLSSWFTKYVYFAKEKELIATTTPSFNPNTPTTREQVAELIYNTIQKGIAEIKEKTEEDQVEIFDDTLAIYSPTFFTDITLTTAIPTTYIKDEVYIIEGKFNNETHKSASIVLSDQKSPKDYTLTTRKITRDTFQIPLHLNKIGDFNIGIITDEGGTTKQIPITVIAQPPTNISETKTPLPINYFGIRFTNDSTETEYTAPEKDVLTKLSITQNGKTVQYFSRQIEKPIQINYKDFKEFNTSQVSYFLETAKVKYENSTPIQLSTWTKSSTKSFYPTTHQFSIFNKNEITANIPEILKTSYIYFTGSGKTEFQKNAIITKPDGTVEEIPLTTTTSENTIPANTSFTFKYTPETTGTYIVEINKTDGTASLNHPVYIGTKIPLLPDFFDTYKYEEPETMSLTEMRNNLLNLINQERAFYGLQAVELDSELNNLAQLHSEDMSKNNYQSHINLIGESPEDRRIKLNIKTPIMENIAVNDAIISAHQGLMRSGSHRGNILNPNHDKVGLGIAIGQNNSTVITEDFTNKKPTETDLEKWEEDILQTIQTQRSYSSITQLIRKPNMDSMAKEITDSTNEGTTITEDLLKTLQTKYDLKAPLQGTQLTTSDIQTILDILKSDLEFINSAWENIGINLQVNNLGELQNTIIIN